MNLSIIIINWNTRELLIQCLASVYTNLPSNDFEIWVVDNASTDDSVQAVREQFPDVQLIQNQHNVGFAQANNQAIRESRGRYVLLLNPDTEVEAGTLQILLRFMEEHPQAGASGPLTLNQDRTLQVSCYPMPTLSRELWRLAHLDKIWPHGSYQMEEWNREQSREVDVLLGACLLLRQEALSQTGLLDESYFMYTEEVDLCYRLQQIGWELYWVPQAKLVHYGGQSTQQVAVEMFLQLYKSKLLFFRKNYGKAAALLYKLILFFTAVPRVLLGPLAQLGPRAQRQKQIELAANYRRLIAALPTM